MVIAMLAWLSTCLQVSAQRLALPDRPLDAPVGSQFAALISGLDPRVREQKVLEEVARGNVPEFMRQLVPVEVAAVIEGTTNFATYYVTPDYLAIGSETDYFLIPLTPMTAQRIADLLQCSLPTRKMVNDIYEHAAVKLVPSPIPPSAAMITVPVFQEHNAIVTYQRGEARVEHPLGALVAGQKKDVVIFARLGSMPGKVGIYGWHNPDRRPIQPLYTGHADTWADYSHGVRLVQSGMVANGKPATVSGVLSDPRFCSLLSDEGPFAVSRYATNFIQPINAAAKTAGSLAKTPDPVITLADFQRGYLGEQVCSYVMAPEIKVHLNAPTILDPGKRIKLIFYALPNGNSTEQTIGRQLNPGDDWHSDIQQIGAQTRFLRARMPDWNVVVAYLEAGSKSWPAWRKAHADQPRRIPEVVHAVRSIFPRADTEIILSGHSGGGSFIFGYLNGVGEIAPEVKRIAFLDANYAYDEAQGHLGKLDHWLKASEENRLVVLAYNDAVALLNGTNFVSAVGGTWGRSHLMVKDLGTRFTFSCQTNAGFETCFALDRRIAFYLKENPRQEILHTVQVERNGFIHCLLLGTGHENDGYAYYGPRAYGPWISPR